MRWLVAVGCALWAAAGPSGRCDAAEHVFVVDGQPARMQCGAAPPGWQRPELDDRRWNVRTTVVERRDNGAPVEADALVGVVGEGGSGPASSARSDGGVRGGGVGDGRAWDGISREDGARGGVIREGGVRDGGSRESGARDSSARESGARESGARDSSARESGARESGARDGSTRDGGLGATDGGVPACAGARFARWHFSVSSELSSLKTITLRIRYTHGFAAYVNGTEIARRRLEPAAPPDALATDVHGPEYESFTVPAGVLRRGDNLLAVEVHPHTAGRDTTVELSLCGNEGARLVRGPYLIGLREREVELVVDTPMPTWAEVRWGRDGDYGSAAHDAFGTHHVLKLAPLEPGTVYHYRVRVRPTIETDSDGRTGSVARGSSDAHGSSNARGSSDAHGSNNARGANDAHSSSNAQGSTTAHGGTDARTVGSNDLDAGDATFHTPPDAGRPLRFAVYGDVRSGHDVHAALNQSLAEEQPDFAILTGDLVDRGSDEGDWESFFDIAGPLLRSLAIFPAIGNHEYASRGRGLVAFMQFFRWPLGVPDDDPPWYSFDIANTHFVALDSNSYKSPRQLSWLEHDLRDARRRGVRAIFVYAHEGPASSGMHGDNTICAREYVPIMERYHVSMFFGGHDHDYERGRIGTLDYVVTGGGGAELRSARCGVPGKRACPPRVAAFVNDHNYVMVEVLPSLFRVCPKRVDGTAIEACTQYPLR